MDYNAATKTGRMTVVRDAIDGGPAAGKLKIGTAGMAVVLATITLNDPSGSVSGNVLTGSGFPKTVAAANTGIAAAAVITDSNDVVVVSGLTVDTASANVIIDNTSINATQNITVSSLAILHG